MIVYGSHSHYSLCVMDQMEWMGLAGESRQSTGSALVHCRHSWAGESGGMMVAAVLFGGLSAGGVEGG